VVSGDYYDVFTLNDRTVALCVGDVVGKGMPAALLMANLQAAVKAISSATITPNELCERVNSVIARNVRPGQFITFFYALIDTASRQLRYTNAGHNPPIVIREGGEVVWTGAGDFSRLDVRPSSPHAHPGRPAPAVHGWCNRGAE
jgi:phosphoserine phosphatase RsbU/P